MGLGGANLGKTMKGGAKKGKEGSGGEAAAPAGRMDATVLAQAQVEREAEYLKKLAEHTKKMLKERLEKEKEYTRVNKKKIENAWLRIMRKTKVDELKKDLEIIAQNHEREVDRRDAILQMLDRDLDEAEEQYQTAIRANLLHMDKLIELQDSRLNALETEFEEQLQTIQEEYTEERKEIEDNHAKAVHEITAVINTIKEQEENKAAVARNNYETAREELRNRSIERIQELSRTLDDEISELESEFEQAHLNYLQNTDAKTEEFKKLTLCDQKATKEIEKKMREIDKLQAQLASWRAKMSANSRDYNDRNESLVKERDHMASHVNELKKRMENRRQTASQRLSEISKAAQESKNKIGENLRLAERILQLSERSRQLMNDEEKVMPFSTNESNDEDRPSWTRGFKTVQDSPGTFEVQRTTTGSSHRGQWSKLMSPTAERSRELAADIRARTGEQAPALRNMPTDSDEDEGAQPAHMHPLPTETGEQKEDDLNVAEAFDSGQIEALENFHQVYNRALMDELTMEAERDRLRQENQQLQYLVQHYLEGVRVKEDTVDDDNPLLVVNGRTGTDQLPVRTTARGGSPVAVNAAETVGKAKMHSTRRG
eukprot:gb/GECG01013409.1/.p1 GENE.gb/GECG01013409.1/~~gb/GECG01013409.1/.p1  ORF type:complete len:602 (+),score=132.67 gb/GECG01013409.1/:1-1806(+)